MKLLRCIDGIDSNFPCGVAATIGNFDGVHCGHQALLAALCAQGNKMQLPVVVVLFEPQPSEYLHARLAPARLTSLREKLQILKQCNVDYVCCLKFNKALATMSADHFISHYCFSLLRIKYLLVGKDFRFGQHREGDFRLIQHIGKNYGCIVDDLPDVTMDNERISSTNVRAALVNGDLIRATKLLGRIYSLCGRVIRGHGLGKQWGIPTANVAAHRLSLALTGVFCVLVKRQHVWFKAVANLGCRPTIDGTHNILEVHLFECNENLLGEMLQVFFLHKIRDEVKFASLEELIRQIQQDVIVAKERLGCI